MRSILICCSLLLMIPSAVFAQAPTAHVQFLHLADDVGAVEVLVNDEPLLVDVKPGTAADFISLPAGEYTVRARQIDGVEVATTSLNLAAESWQVVSLVGSIAQNFVGFNVQEVHPADFSPGHGRMYFFNPLSDGTRLDIFIDDGLWDSLGYGGFQVREFPQGVQNLRLQSGEEVLMDFNTLPIQAYRLYVVALTADMVVVAESDFSAQLRVYQWSPDLPSLALTLDGTPVLSPINYESHDAVATIPAGTYAMQFITDNVAEPEVFFADDSYTFLPGSLTQVEFSGQILKETFRVNVQRHQPDTYPHAVTSGQNAYITLRHELTDAPPLDVMLTDGTVLIDGLAFREGEAILDILPGDYDMLITAHRDPATVVYDLTDITLRGGTAYVFVAIGRYQDVLNGAQRLFIESQCLLAAGC